MYTILTDSCSDLNAQIAARFTQLEVLPLSYTISGQTSTQPFDDAARCSAFYDRLRAGRRAPRLRFRREILPRRLKRMRKRARLCWG